MQMKNECVYSVRLNTKKENQKERHLPSNGIPIFKEIIGPFDTLSAF
jgi:hypothetical protein